MSDLILRMLSRLRPDLTAHISWPGENRYVAATDIWSRTTPAMPRAVLHCRTAQDVQAAVRAARECDLPLSVRAGGHDWAGRALCEGLVIDMSGMRSVAVGSDQTAQVLGGARAAD